MTSDPISLLRDVLGATVIPEQGPAAREVVPLVRRDRRCRWAGCGQAAVVAVEDCHGRLYLCEEHRRTAAATSTDPQSALVARAARPDYDRWLARALVARGCARPVRLRPSMLRADPATGELTPAVAKGPRRNKFGGLRRVTGSHRVVPVGVEVVAGDR